MDVHGLFFFQVHGFFFFQECVHVCAWFEKRCVRLGRALVPSHLQAVLSRAIHVNVPGHNLKGARTVYKGLLEIIGTHRP